MSITEKDMKLFNNVIQKGKLSSSKNLVDLKKIIQVDIFDCLAKNAPPDFPQLYYNFVSEFERFSDFISRGHLFDKNIVTLAGAFSSGKSSFANTILKKSILPADINPSTATPTYVIKGEILKSTALNMWNHSFPLTLSDLKYIAHNNFDETEIAHMIKNIYIETPAFPFSHLAFLDTPGYSRAKSLDIEEISDEELSEYHLNVSDLVLWFTSADVGSITEKDINLLLRIKKEIPKLIIVNKSDKITESQLKEVITQIKTSLDDKAINYIDVLSFSKRRPEDFDFEKILSILNNFNKEKNEFSFINNFSDFFEKIKNYYDRQLIFESRRLYRLNTAITLLSDDFVINNLINLTDEIKDNMKSYNKLNFALKKIRSEFFSELQKIGIIISEENLLIEELPSNNNFMKFLYSYKDKNDFKKDFDIFREIKKYSKDLQNIIFTTEIERNFFENKKIVSEFSKMLNLEKETLVFGSSNYSEIIYSYLKNLS